MTIEYLYNGTVSYNTDTNLYVVSEGISGEDIGELLRTAEDYSTVHFNAGNFVLTEGIHVRRGNLTIEGAGEDLTTFTADFDTPATILRFSGYYSYEGLVSEDISVGDTEITVENAAEFKVGDVVHIFQDNDLEYLDQAIPEGFEDNPYLPDDLIADIIESGSLNGLAVETAMKEDVPLRTNLSEIVAIDGNTITLKDSMTFDMEGYVAEIRKFEAPDNLEISDFTITTNLGEADGGLLENTLEDWKGKDVIRIERTVNTEVHDITILNAPSEGLDASQLYNANIYDLTVIGSHNKGGGGNGYGIHIAGTQHSSFTDLTLMDVRHGVVFSSWDTEVGNVVHVSETNRDVNFHGGPDQDNLVVVDNTQINYGESSTTTGYSVLSTFGEGHPYTDIEANTTLFSYAVGYMKEDVIYGSDFGAFLRGGFNNDTLVGGAGDDVIIGDSHTDTLTGNGGADLFVFTNDIEEWGGIDIVTDFNPLEGDLIVIDHNSVELDMSDLAFRQIDANLKVWSYALNSGMLLLDTELEDFDESWVVFNDRPYSDDPADYYYDYRILFGEEPVLDESMVFQATSADDIFVGGNNNDVVTGWTSAVIGDVYDLGQGVDMLQLSAYSLWMHEGRMPEMYGVDVLDVSDTNRVYRLQINEDHVAQSDDGRLVLLNSDDDLITLRADIQDEDLMLVIESAGDIYLDDATDNMVYLSDDHTGVVYGGGGDDTIFLGAGGDVIFGGSGADLFVLTLNENGAVDTIGDFDHMLGDVLDLSTYLGGFDPVQDEIDAFVSGTQNGDGHIEVFIDRDGSGEAYSAKHVVTLLDMSDTEFDTLLENL